MKIKLYNRDRADLWLEKIEDSKDLWELKVDDDHIFVLNYMRMGGDFEVIEKPDGKKIDWKEIKMIDPVGGPYLEVGDKIENYTIKEIVDSTILRLE